MIVSAHLGILQKDGYLILLSLPAGLGIVVSLSGYYNIRWKIHTLYFLQWIVARFCKFLKIPVWHSKVSPATSDIYCGFVAAVEV